MLAPATTARICLLQALSQVGRCRSFDATGDGYGRGEGFTVALLRQAPTLSFYVINYQLSVVSRASNMFIRESLLTRPRNLAHDKRA